MKWRSAFRRAPRWLFKVIAGRMVLGATVLGATVLGATVLGATVLGATVLGATALGAAFSSAVEAQQAVCVEDAALSNAAAELLASDASLDARSIAEAARRAGSDAISLKARLFGNEDRRSSQTWLAGQRQWAEGTPRCGEAQGEAKRLVLVAQAGGRLLRSSSGRLVARLDVGFSSPELVFLGADGAMERRALEPVDLDQGVEAPAGLSAPMRIQLLARGPRGMRPVAEILLEAPRSSPMEGRSGDPLRIRVHTPEPLPPGAVPSDATLPQRVADLRRRYRVAPLRANALLRSEAIRQAEAICASGEVSHEREGRDPEARLARRGILARVVGEAVAKAGTAAEAYQAIEESPSHRMTVVDARFTDAGFAQVYARSHVCAVVLLAAWPRRVAAVE